MALIAGDSIHFSDLIADVPRDARELFIVINGFEWKRKICAKFDPTKLKQLIMDGLVCCFLFQVDLL